MPYSDEQRTQALQLWASSQDAELVCEQHHLPRSTLYSWLGQGTPKITLSEADKIILAERACKGWAIVDDALMKLERQVNTGNTVMLRGKKIKVPLSTDELTKVINTLAVHANRWEVAANAADPSKEFEVDREIVELQKLVAIKQYRQAS